jgi:hypothetical protein
MGKCRRGYEDKAMTPDQKAWDEEVNWATWYVPATESKCSFDPPLRRNAKAILAHDAYTKELEGKLCAAREESKGDRVIITSLRECIAAIARYKPDDEWIQQVCRGMLSLPELAPPSSPCRHEEEAKRLREALEYIARQEPPIYNFTDNLTRIAEAEKFYRYILDVAKRALLRLRTEVKG